MSNVRRRTVFALVLGALVLSIGTAHAQSQSTTSSSKPFVVLTGHIDVAEGDTVTDAVIFNGPVDVEGTVEHNVVAFNGDVTIAGSVGGDVVSLNGRVTVTAGAHVAGNVESQLPPSVAAGTVAGEVRHASNFRVSDATITFVGRLVIWIIATGSSFLLGLALTLWMPRAADALAETGTRRTGASFGFGALWFFVIPIAAGLLAATVLATLVGLSVLLALLLLYTVAYAIGLFLLGRRILPRQSRFVSFFAAWVIFRIVALLPVLGGIAWFVAVIYGLGAFLIAGWRAARTGPEAPATAALSGPSGGALPPVPPMPV